jgi:outer membrane protein W
MIKFLLSITIFISTLSALSQEKKLLKNYTYRIDRFNAFNFGLGANAGQRNFYSANNDISRSVSGSLSANYFTSKSTDKLLQTATMGFATNSSSLKSTGTSNTDKSNDFRIAPAAVLSNKWYFNNKFVEIAPYFSYAYSTSHSKKLVSPVQDDNGTNSFMNGSITIGVGKGRLENITDMQNAIWLHNILLKEADLKQKLSDEEIIGLAKTITNANNRRVLDGRKRIQYILQKVDGYLQAKELVNKTDMHYFSNLNDVLFFANNTTRQAGTEKYIRFIPSFVNNVTKFEQHIIPTSSNKSIVNGAEIAMKIGLQQYKPLNLAHQIDYGAAVKLNYGKAKENYTSFLNANVDYNYKLTDEWRKIGLDYFFSYSIIPNTRTNINFNLQAENGYQRHNGLNEVYHSLVFGAGADYFISYNTRFNFNIGTIYNNNNFDIRAFNRYYTSNLDTHDLSLFCNANLAIAF